VTQTIDVTKFNSIESFFRFSIHDNQIFLASYPSSKVFNIFIIEAKLIQEHYQRQAIERFQKSIPTAEEAITPPWAIQYNLSQRPKTSNLNFRIFLF